MKMNDREKRWHDNAESARRVGKQFGLILRGFDPNWSFHIPEYIVSRETTVDLPDFMVGLLAERFGIPWIWGEGMDSHPSDQLNKYHQKKNTEIKNLNEMLKQLQHIDGWVKK